MSELSDAAEDRLDDIQRLETRVSHVALVVISNFNSAATRLCAWVRVEFDHSMSSV